MQVFRFNSSLVSLSRLKPLGFETKCHCWNLQLWLQTSDLISPIIRQHHTDHQLLSSTSSSFLSSPALSYYCNPLPSFDSNPTSSRLLIAPESA